MCALIVTTLASYTHTPTRTRDHAIDINIDININIVMHISACLVGLGNTSRDSGLDAAVVLTTQDLEGTLVSPVFGPRVHAVPVLDTILHTVSKDLDGVATKLAAAGVLVDATGVGGEVSVHGEGTGNGTVLDELSHDVLFALDGVGFLGKVLVLREGCGVLAVLAGRETRVRRGARAVAALARLDGVRPARVIGAVVGVVTTRDNTVRLEVLPRVGGLTPAAAEGEAVEEVAARGHMLGRQQLLEVTVGGHAETVIEGLGGAKGPARTAVRLVTHVTDHTRALRKGLTGIKVLGQIVIAEGSEVGGGRERHLLLAVEEGTAEVGDVLEGVALEVLVEAGGPGLLHAAEGGHLMVG